MKLARFYGVFLLAVISSTAQANLITNGDFSTCDFTGWNKDTDGFQNPDPGNFVVGTGNDFEIDNASLPDCSAVLNVDFFETAGDTFSAPFSEAWFANTLFQDITGLLEAGKEYKLDLDFSIAVEGISRPGFFFIPDFYSIGLFNGANYVGTDGNLGFLVAPTDVFGDVTEGLSFTLDGDIFSAFTSLSLDFQVGIGFDQLGSDAFGTALLIHNVVLTEVASGPPSTDVPEPGTLVMVALSLVGIAGIRKRNKHYTTE